MADISANAYAQVIPGGVQPMSPSLKKSESFSRTGELDAGLCPDCGAGATTGHAVPLRASVCLAGYGGSHVMTFVQPQHTLSDLLLASAALC